jgi:hypothetical protein
LERIAEMYGVDRARLERWLQDDTSGERRRVFED